MKDFLNYDSMYECIKCIYEDAIDNPQEHEEYIEEFAAENARRFVSDMRKYVHQNDTEIVGNFNNIRNDWDYIKESFLVAKDENSEAVEIKPFGKFDDMVKGMDDGTLTDEQIWMVQQWCEEWFFETFGTWGLKYNFQNFICELEYEEEMEVG